MSDVINESVKKSSLSTYLFWAVIILAVAVPVVVMVLKNQSDSVQAASSEMFEEVYEDLKEFDALNTVSKQGEKDNLIKSLDAVIAAFPGAVSSERCMFYKGYVSYAASDFENASVYFSDFIAKYTKSHLLSKAYYYQSFALYEMDKKDEAIKMLNTLINKVKDAYYAPFAYYRLGELYELMNDKENSIANYKAVVEQYAKSSQADNAKKRLALLK